MVLRRDVAVRTGERLRAIRQASERSPTQVAAALGLATETYRLYERGVSVLRVDQLVVLAEVFGQSTAEFVRALGLLDDTRAWNAYDAMIEGGIAEADARERARIIAGRPNIDQRDYVAGLLGVRERALSTAGGGRHSHSA